MARMNGVAWDVVIEEIDRELGIKTLQERTFQIHRRMTAIEFPPNHTITEQQLTSSVSDIFTNFLTLMSTTDMVVMPCMWISSTFEHSKDCHNLSAEVIAWREIDSKANVRPRPS